MAQSRDTDFSFFLLLLVAVEVLRNDLLHKLVIV